MEIKFNCSNPACWQRISVDESFAGKMISCPACNTVQPAPASKTSGSYSYHIEHAGHGFKTENYKTSYPILVKFILEDY